MKEFNTTKWRQFIIEEAALTEADFGNDIEDRYAYVRPLLQTLPDTERVDFLVRGLDDGRMMDDKMEFDYYFVELMKLLGREDELMEEMNPEADEIDAEDLEAAAEFFDGLDEELFTPNEMSAMAIEKEMQEGKGIPDVNTDFSVGTDFSDDLSENDAVLDEIVKDAKFEVGDKVTMKAGGEEMEVVGERKMFGNNMQAYKVKKADGETVEYSANQLKKA